MIAARSAVTRTCAARPSCSSVMVSGVKPDCLLQTAPPVIAAMSSSLCSALAPAAVGFDGGAGDIRRIWGEQKRDHGGDFGRLGQPAECALRADERVKRYIGVCRGV